MAEQFAAEIVIRARDLASPALTGLQQSLDRTSLSARGAQAESLSMGRRMNEAESFTQSASSGIVRSAGQTEGAFGRMGGAADLWAEDYRAAARDLGLSNEQIGDDMRRMARETGRATDQAGDEMGRFRAATRGTGEQTRESVGFMSRAWRGLDIVDDIGGVIGMVDGLTRGMRDLVEESVRAAGGFEMAMARFNSLQITLPGGAGGELATEQLEQLEQRALLYATRRTGELSELAPMRPEEYVRFAKEAFSTGIISFEASMPMAEYSSALARIGEAPIGDAAELMRALYVGTADKTADPRAEIQRLFDEVAMTQALYDIPSLSAYTEAISSAITLSSGMGMTSAEIGAAVGSFFNVGKKGSEGGEALSSLNEELVSGFADLGIAVPTTPEGNLDFIGAMNQLAALDLGDTRPEEMARLQETFGELGSVSVQALIGSQRDALLGGAQSIREADDADVGLARLRVVADTVDMRRETIDVGRDAVNVMRGQAYEPATRAWQQWRMDAQDETAASYDRAGEIMEGYAAGELSRLQAIWQSLSLDSAGASLGVWLGMRRESGRAIPETMAAGVPEGGPALGGAVEGMLRTEVEPLLSHSDALRGPLSRLTEAGRAIPQTMAVGVLQSQGILGAALSGSLALPEVAELTAAFGAVDDPLLPESPLTELQARFGAVDDPPLPLLAPLALTAAFGDVEPPLLPAALGVLGLQARFGDVAPPLLPDSPLTELLATFGAVEAPLLPQTPLTELLAAFGAVDSPLLPLLAPLALTAAFGAVEPPLLPDSPLTELQARFGAVDSPLLPPLAPLALTAAFGAVESPELEPLALLAGIASPAAPPSLSALAQAAAQERSATAPAELGELLRTMRALVDELRAARGAGRSGDPAAAGGAVKIERLDLHARDGMLQTLADLHYLVQDRRR